MQQHFLRDEICMDRILWDHGVAFHHLFYEIGVSDSVCSRLIDVRGIGHHHVLLLLCMCVILLRCESVCEGTPWCPVVRPRRTLSPCVRERCGAPL